jgi:hypothetical protein
MILVVMGAALAVSSTAGGSTNASSEERSIVDTAQPSSAPLSTSVAPVVSTATNAPVEVIVPEPTPAPFLRSTTPKPTDSPSRAPTAFPTHAPFP